MFDCHMHCIHSADSNTPLDVMIEAALAKGMKYVAFTDHLDRDYLYENNLNKDVPQLDVARHIEKTAEAKAKYAGAIEVAVGLECGYSKFAAADYCNILKGVQLDVVLNSVHSVSGADCYQSEFFAGKDRQTAYTQYLLAVLDSVHCPYDYDVITHIGYVCRRAPFDKRDMQFADFADIFDSILKGIIARGVSLELNSHNRGLDTPFLPYASIAERYIELGGTDFTYGSDAHRVDRVCDKFDLVKDWLLSKNQKYINIYKNRQKIKIDLTKI